MYNTDALQLTIIELDNKRKKLMTVEEREYLECQIQDAIDMRDSLADLNRVRNKMQNLLAEIEQLTQN